MPPTKHDDPARRIYLRPGETDPLHGDKRYRERMGFSPATPKSAIHKEDRDSVLKRMSNFARNVMSDFRHPVLTYKAANAEYRAWNEKNKIRGGKNKSRKSRKNIKTRSRKNRKTRSRK
jgi:hypothetical protein